jgi:hypothetical protein
MAAIKDYVTRVAYRKVGNTTKQYIDKPIWENVLNILQLIEYGEVEYLSLIGPENECVNMDVVCKPGNYHIGIFINEDEEYLFKNPELSNSKIDIAGEYWPSSQVCTKFGDLTSIAKEFFKNGKPSNSHGWIYYSEED